MSDQYNYSNYAPPNSTMAIVSLVAGILGLTLFPLLGSIVALVTAQMAKREIEESGGTIGGENLARIGMILGWIGLALGLCFCCIFVASFALPFLMIAAEEGGYYFILPLLF